MIIERLVNWMESAPLDKRVKATDALVRAWQMSSLSDDERDAAEAAMTCILDDQDVEVRLALAEALSDIPNPPRHLVLALAADEPEVSIPILAHCSALLDIELLHYVKSGNDDQQFAIAARPLLTKTVCKLMAKEGCKGACLAMVTNPEAKLDENDFYNIAERFGDWSELRKCLLVRHDIGMRARILLIEFYATTLIEVDPEADPKTKLRKEKELQDVCEKATITFAAQISDQEISDLVCALIERQKLTTVFLLRAICMGNLSLFAHSLSVLSDQPLGRVERILKDNRSNALHALYAKAGLPISALTVFCSAITSWRAHLEADIMHAPERLPYLVTKQVLANYEGQRDEIVEELLMLLRKICTEAARDNARSKVEQYALEAQQPLALAAPEEEAEPDMSEVETMAFMLEFADQLADIALQDEQDLNEVAEDLVAANQDNASSPNSRLADEAFMRSLELPEVDMRNEVRADRAA
ncbi:MAG: DUF2336 domain-containing protein [Salaquimonas sp.]